MSSAPAEPESLHNEEYGDSQPEDAAGQPSSSSSPQLLDVELPQSELDLTMTFESILAETASQGAPETEIVQKRASNVFKLTQENEKLKEELRAMTERLEAAERRQRELKLKAGGSKGGDGSS